MEYRYGYQGQFAEKDEETGWNHFELRGEYDPIVARWTAVDPKRIGWSPYTGMYNNPVSGTDPDGGGPDDWYRNDDTGATIRRGGSAGSIEIDGQVYRNIGESYSFSKGGMAFNFNQNDLISAEELTRFDVDGGIRLPSSFYLMSGTRIDVEFGNSRDGVSSNRFLRPALVQSFVTLMENTGDANCINSVYVSATTNGQHAVTSNHYVQNRGAIDISRINGAHMVNMPTDGVILNIQNAIENLPNRRENFGPAFNRRLGIEILPNTDARRALINNHVNHIHYSIN